MKTNNTKLVAKLAEVEATISYTKPYAELVAKKGLDITQQINFGINQGHIDRARLFCEAVARRSELEAMLEVA